MLREQSVRVREAAAQQLEERQSDWAYSKPVIALDMLWNAAFIGIAVVVERRRGPLAAAEGVDCRLRLPVRRPHGVRDRRVPAEAPRGSPGGNGDRPGVGELRGFEFWFWK